MKNLQYVLQFIFKRTSIKDIMEGRVTYAHFPKEIFTEIARDYIANFSGNDVDNLYNYLISAINNKYDTRWNYKNFNVLEPLKLFNSQVLRLMSNEPVCSYGHLLRWRSASFSMEETLFITSFIAWEDQSRAMKGRREFNWKSVIGNDNVILNNMLQQGIAENHFHLKGSAPYFGLTWVNLMNMVDYPKFLKVLQEYEEDRLHTMGSTRYSGEEESLRTLYLKAALIRAYLFAQLRGDVFQLKDEYEICLKRDWEYLNTDGFNKEAVLKVGELTERILEYRRENSLRLVRLKEMVNIIAKGVPDLSDDMKAFFRYLPDDVYCSEKLFEDYHQDAILKERELLILLAGRGGCFRGGNRMVRRLIRVEKQGVFLREQNRRELYRILAGGEDIYIICSYLKNYVDLYRKSRVINEYDYMNTMAGTKLEENMYCAERWFMYKMFYRMYDSDVELEDGNLFYAYLIIKQRIRDELVQVNNRVGFYNFKHYQDRKEKFIDGTPLEKCYISYAMKESFQGQNMLSLEARVAPRKTAEDNRRYIAENYDNQLKGIIIDGKRADLKDRVFYVYHFIKENDTHDGIEMNICRRHKMRNNIRRQALAIAGMRLKYPAEASRVLGIDACSEEIGCRPELFGQAYRFLKNMREINYDYTNYSSGNSIDPESGREIYARSDGMQALRATFHVGEDFTDIVDGMRAIDEAIYYLNLSYGDRLGHALAIGIPPDEWYGFKRRRVLITRQDHLDNLVWLYQKIRKYNIRHTENILLSLEREFVHCFHEIYGGTSSENMWDYDINVYYDAWKLRGDAPELYQSGRYVENKEKYQEWDFFAENLLHNELRKIRMEERCTNIYARYLYDENVKRVGGEIVELKVPIERISIISQIQKYMQNDIAAMGLGIEANPSSNYLISPLQYYDRHPIGIWYNKGLTYNEKELQNCPQISVTINTDDQAVFGTSLENEFALIAVAWEKHRDETGRQIYQKEMIYEWLNNIRLNGIKWSFGQK